jgi:hypothetical protein
MVESGMLISLVERRQRLSAAAESTSNGHRPTAGRPIGLTLFVAAVLALGILIAGLSSDHGMNRMIELPAQVRSPWQRQTLAEVRTFCSEPAAASGALHEHCVAEARFLLLFPECDPGCRREAWSIVSPYHR